MTAEGKLKLRPASEFFDTKCFSMPEQSVDGFSGRVQTNLLYYQANYLLVVIVFMLYVCVARPQFIFALLVCSALGVYLVVVRQGPAVVFGQLVTRKQSILGWAVGSSVVLFVAGGTAMLISLLLGLLFVVLHASFRQRSLKARGSNFVGGNSTPLGAAFRSLDDAFESIDDEESPKRDMENPRVPQRQSPMAATTAAAAGGGGGPYGYPNPAATAPYVDFRTQMRNKYPARKP